MSVREEREKRVAEILIYSYYNKHYTLPLAKRAVESLEFLKQNECIRPLVGFIFKMKCSEWEQIGQRSLIDLLRSGDFQQYFISKYGQLGLKTMQVYAEQIIRVIEEHDLLPEQTPRKNSLEDNDSR